MNENIKYYLYLIDQRSDAWNTWRTLHFAWRHSLPSTAALNPRCVYYPQMNEWMKCREWEDNKRVLFTLFANMLAVSSDVSIQGRHWQPCHQSIYGLTVTHQAYDMKGS